MPDLNTEIIIVLVLLVLAALLVRRHAKRLRKKEKAFHEQFYKLETSENIKFTRKEIFQNVLLGLDENERKVVVVKKEVDAYPSYVIDLRQVKNCTVERSYYDSPASTIHTINNQRPEDQLSTINLEFHLSDAERPSVSVPFYRANENTLSELPGLEMNAMEWQRLILKKLKEGRTRST